MRSSVRACRCFVDGIADLAGEDLDEPQGVELAVEVDEQHGRFAAVERHASASPRRHRVHRGLHENLSLARSTDAAHLEELAGAEGAVRVHEGYSRQHGIHQYPGEERRAWWRDRRGGYRTVSARSRDNEATGDEG